MSHVHHVVLDEADTLLDDSFNEKLCHFLRKFKVSILHTSSIHELFWCFFLRIWPVELKWVVNGDFKTERERNGFGKAFH
jgi:Superfamily II DNA and RNA helicases